MHTLTVDIVAISYSGNKFHILQISYSLKSFEDNVSWNFVTGFTKSNLIVTFCISRNANLRHCSSLMMLDSSHAKFALEVAT